MSVDVIANNTRRVNEMTKKGGGVLSFDATFIVF